MVLFLHHNGRGYEVAVSRITLYLMMNVAATRCGESHLVNDFFMSIALPPSLPFSLPLSTTLHCEWWLFVHLEMRRKWQSYRQHYQRTRTRTRTRRPPPPPPPPHTQGTLTNAGYTLTHTHRWKQVSTEQVGSSGRGNTNGLSQVVYSSITPRLFLLIHVFFLLLCVPLPRLPLRQMYSWWNKDPFVNLK